MKRKYTKSKALSSCFSGKSIVFPILEVQGSNLACSLSYALTYFQALGFIYITCAYVSSYIYDSHLVPIFNMSMYMCDHDAIRDHMVTDEFVKDVLDHIIPDRASSSQWKNPRNDYNQFCWHDGLLFRQNLLYVLDDLPHLQVLQHFHDTPMAGYFGIHKTFELISRRYWWP